jgi:tRNA threonylcarbamoyladenosine biosynthesis protein TsaE
MRILSNSPKDTINLGQSIASLLKKGDIICLFGELGSGKTTFVKGLAQGLGLKKDAVNSPSFVLMKEFKGKLPLFHFDLYRLKNLRQILDLGIEEYLFDNGVSVIEWADRLKGLSLNNFLKVEINIKGNMRRLLKITPYGLRYKNLIKTL